MTTARRQQALAFFTRQGWTLAQSAGIVANLEAESALRPDAVGDGGAAYGIAQWHPDRQSNFRAIMGRDIRGSSFEDQLYFVHAELQSTEKRAGDALSACTSAAEAGACVSRLYERPADRDGEAAKRATRAESIYAAAQEGQGAAIPPDEPSTPIPTEKKPMLPLLLPSVISLIPQLIGILGKGGERAAQNAQAAQAVADAVIKATDAVNLQQAVEKMQADPVLKASATAAVLQEPAIASLLEVGGGIPEAHRYALAQSDPSGPWWRFLANAAFYIALVTIPLIYMVVYRVLWDGGSSEQLKTVVVTAILSGLLGSVTGFFFGSAYSNTRTRPTQPTQP